jgi:hypothetical protein
VDEEAPDELAGGERHRLVAGRPIEPIVLVPEGDAVLIGGYEPAIGDGCDKSQIARLPGRLKNSK